MKKFLLMALIAAIPYVVVAQTAAVTIKASKAINKEATPQQVIDSLKKRFPNAEAVQYYETTADVARGWTVSAEDDMTGGDAADYYTIAFKRHDFQYYALFEADGTLVKSEFQQKNAELPKAVQDAIKKLAADKNYSDYKIESKNYYKYENYDMHKDYYEIIAVKKSDPTQKKIVTVDPEGKIISDK